MNYACMTDRSFAAKEKPNIKKELSSDARSRKEFILSHDFYIVDNPNTKEKELKAEKKVGK